MKKLLIVIITSLFAVSAHAQLYVGGNIGLTSGRDGTGIGINIAPELGYAYTKYATYSTSGWIARVDGDSISVGVCVDLGWR